MSSSAVELEQSITHLLRYTNLSEMLVAYFIHQFNQEIQDGLSQTHSTVLETYRSILLDINAYLNSPSDRAVIPDPRYFVSFFTDHFPWLEMLREQQAQLDTFSYLLLGTPFLPSSKNGNGASNEYTRTLLTDKEEQWLSQTILTATYVMQLAHQCSGLLSPQCLSWIQQHLALKTLAQERFLLSNEGLVHSISNRYHSSVLTEDDLLQEGRMGVLRASA